MGEGVRPLLPGPVAGVVRAAGVGRDQQPDGARVVESSASVPPATDGLHGARSGVVVGPDVYPASVGGEVVDTVGHGNRLAVGDEVAVAVHLDRILAWAPGASGPVAVAIHALALVSTLITG